MGGAIGVEDILFGFFIAGIASVIYEEIFGKHFAKRKNRRHHWSWFLIPLAALFLFSFNILFFLFNLNSIYTAVIAFLIFSSVMLWYRRDLITDALISGILVGGVFVIGYLIYLSMFPEIIHHWWMLHNLSGIFFLGIPVEELLWAFGWGMVAGPVYEFFMGLKLEN